MYPRLIQAFERIFGATIFFGTDTSHGSAKVIQRSRFNFMREAQIWCNRNPDQQPISSEFENVIVLSDDFYQEILAHPIPNDLEAVKLLGSAPAVLDLYMWLSYRSPSLTPTESTWSILMSFCTSAAVACAGTAAVTLAQHASFYRKSARHGCG